MPGLHTASSSLDASGSVHVVVTPSQSSFFAGEPFSVTVTFTNTRSPEAGPSRSAHAHSHKRNAHSISSAPLARPPTSPGLPPARTPAHVPSVHITPNSPSADAPPAAVRRGLIGKVPPAPGLGKPKEQGKDDTELPELLEQRRKRLLAKSKSLSVSIGPHEVEEQLGEAGIGPLPKSAGYVYADPRIPPTSPRVSSPLTRSDALPLSSKHPHARKASVLEGGQAEVTSAPTIPYTPASSTSTFSLALDPIVEGVSSPYPSTPSLVSPTVETGIGTGAGNAVYAYPSATRRQHQSQTQLGLGIGHHPHQKQKSSPYASTSALSPRTPTHPNTELILYSYVKLTGSLLLAPTNPHALSSEQRTALAQTRAALLRRTVVGGGRMDISASLTESPGGAPTLGHGHAGEHRPGHRRRPTHSRSSSFSAGLLSLLSPSAAAAAAGPPSPSSPLGPGFPPAPRSASASYAHGHGHGRGHGHRRHPSTAGLAPSPVSPYFPGSFPNSNSSPHPSPSTASPGVGLGIGLPNGSSDSVNGHGHRGGALTSPLVGYKHGYGDAGLGLDLDLDTDADPDAPLPVFEVQPAMLAVDLALAPGESRSYTYTLPLPDVLPPTFRGRALKFAYELEVGTCRAGPGAGSSTPTSAGASAGAGSVSRVMKVPIRVYNHVAVGRPSRPYDLLWPVSRSRTAYGYTPSGAEMQMQVQGTVVEEPVGAGKSGVGMQRRIPAAGSIKALLAPHPPPAPASASTSTPTHASASGPAPTSTAQTLTGTYSDLQDYARRLLGSFPDPPDPEDARAQGRGRVRIKLPAEAISPVPLSASEGEWGPGVGVGVGVGREMDDGDGRRLEREMEREMERMEREGEGGLSGCREAVEVLTRNPKKASYDVNKDGVKVAVLTFTKGAYRLGETVLGVVEINQRTSRARVLQLSAILESHESLPSPLSPSSPSSRQTQTQRRVHAEHHASFTSHTLRTTFSLDIPSDAAPAFLLRLAPPAPGAPPTAFGGLEWKVRLCLLVAVAAEDAVLGTEGVRVRGMVRDGEQGAGASAGAGAGAGGKGGKGTGKGDMGWGSSWRACDGIAPMEKVKPPLKLRTKAQAQAPSSPTQAPTTPMGWGAFLAASLFGRGDAADGVDGDGDGSAYAGLGHGRGDDDEGEEDEEDEWYDGIKPNLAGGVGVGVNFGGGDEGWRAVKVETVECEVPIKMWPGNTAFRAQDIVFDV